LKELSHDALYQHEAIQEKKDADRSLKEINQLEDDCDCIGGKKEMTITYVGRDLKKKIKSIVVKEFAGIDDLPDKISDLMK